MPTRDEIEAELLKLPPEQHAAFLAEVEKRMGAAPAEPAAPLPPSTPWQIIKSHFPGAEMAKGAGEELANLAVKASRFAGGGMGAGGARVPMPEPTHRFEPQPGESTQEHVGRFVGRALPQVALAAATSGESIPLQMALQGAGQAAQTGIEGGTPGEMVGSGLLGAAAPPAAGLATSVGESLIKKLGAGASAKLIRLLGLDPGEALKYITPEGGAEMGAVRRASEQIGVGTGMQLARRASTAAKTAGEELGAIKGQIGSETLPVDLLDELENAVRTKPLRFEHPDLPAPSAPGTIVNPQGQLYNPGVAPTAAHLAPESVNPELGAFDKVANDIKAIADRYRAAGQAEVPVSELLKLRTMWGDVAENVFSSLAPAAEKAAARAAGAGYGPTTEALHTAFPELAKADLTFHESKLVADALRGSVMKSITGQQAGPEAVAMKAALGLPFMAESSTGVLTHLPQSYGSLMIAMKMVTSPLWRSFGVAQRLALADAIEKGALSTGTRYGMAAAGRLASTPPGEVTGEQP